MHSLLFQSPEMVHNYFTKNCLLSMMQKYKSPVKSRIDVNIVLGYFSVILVYSLWYSINKSHQRL